MNAWFLSYLAGCAVVVGFFGLQWTFTGWRKWSLVLAGYALAWIVAVAVPACIFVCLERPGFLS